MKKPKLKIIIICTVLLGTFWACKHKDAKADESYLPLDVASSCTLTETKFNQWFKSGKATENGVVMPANSVDFIHDNNCDFYKWSEQMFLWITSSDANNEFGGGNTIMESPTFYTISPKENGKRYLIPHKKGQLMRAMANVDKTGRIDSEESQATDDVLMDKNGHLVYYISMANDGYAEYLTAVKNNKMSGKTFPTTAAERDSIFMFAKERGGVLKAPNTLAIELKTSWVVADELKNASDYVLVDAIIPTYEKTESTWIINGERKAKLAMIGMHIVGSTAGHPELVWATFEHETNAPNLAYEYINTAGKTITVDPDKGKEWLLNTDLKDKANVSHMQFFSDTIKSNKGYTISPSNTKRTKPWGSGYHTQPNAEDASAAASNSEVIAINNAIRAFLPGKDIRKKYLLLGATWTSGGAGPNGLSYSPTSTVAGVAIGTSQLANSTMETYIQNGADYDKNGTCFYCHSNNGGLLPSDLSHVFGAIVPLSGTNTIKVNTKTKAY